MIRHLALISTVAVVALLFMLLLVLPQPQPDLEDEKIAKTIGSDTFLLQNVRILRQDDLSDPQSVLIRDGLIDQIGTLPGIDAARTLDGEGGVLLPGLIDSHTHSYGSSLADSLRFGVTVNLDMFVDRRLLPAARLARERVESTREADLWSAGMLATAPDGHGTQFGVAVEPITEATDVSRWVAERKSEGSDYIKLVYIPGAARLPSISREQARAVIEAAHQQGLMAVAHISTQEAARHLVEDGIDGLVHVFADTVASDEFIELARAREIFVIPTLAVIESVSGRGDLEALLAEMGEERLLSPMQRQTLGARFGPGVPGFELEIALENVRLLHGAGIPILAGSDAPNPGTAQGISLHRELQLLVEAGLSEVDALRAASSLPAEIFDLPGRGAIGEGARADLLLLAGNPLDDIRQTLSIRQIVKNGHLVPRVIGEGPSAPVLEGELLGDFEGGLDAPNDFAWGATDDGMMNGASSGKVERVPEGAGASAHALRIDASVRSGFPFPWAGAGVMSQSGADISEYRFVQFDVRGTPGSYRLLGFNLGAMGIPPTANFQVTEQWETRRILIDDLEGLETAQFMGLSWVAGPETGDSTLYLDNVRLMR